MPTWREIIYNTGDVFLPKTVRDVLGTILFKYPNVEEEYIFYIQGWSIVHFISGMVFGYLYTHLGFNDLNYYYNAFIIHTLWELWQIAIGMSKPFKLSGRNSFVDIIVDTIFFMIGAYIVKKQ
jgi:hypothetical protein